MKNKTLDQAIHDKLWQLSAELVGNENVYEYRPMEDVGYPFIDFQDFQTNFNGSKNGITATNTANINVWNTQDNRKQVSEACNDLIQQLLNISDMFGYQVKLNATNSSIQIIKDTTVKPFVWRGMVSLYFLI